MALSFETQSLKNLADSGGMSEALETLWQTVRQPRFPGALLPVRSAGRLVVYAAAETEPEWRKLQPLLRAFAGPTLTDFHGASSNLDAGNPFEAALSVAGLHSVARIRPGRFDASEAIVLRALARLQDRLLAAPDLSVARPEPTSRLLARLQDALNVGDVDCAWNVLDVMRRELRLDAMNLAQLEMRILAATGQWNAIRWHDRFEVLASSAPPPATCEILLDALYHSHLFGLDLDDQAARYLSDVAPFAEPLLRRVETSALPGIARLQELARSIVIPVADHPGPPPDPSGPTDRARHALLAVAASSRSGDPEIDGAAFEAVTSLDAATRADVLTRPVFHALWAEVQERLGHEMPPRSWRDWLSRLPDPRFDAVGYAAAGAAKWVVGDVDLDPAEAAALANGLLGIAGGLAEERLSEGMPYIVSWASADARWPRGSLAPVYLALLTCMAIGTRRSNALVRSSALILEGVLRCGIGPAEYRDALEAAGEICRSGLNRSSAYDAIEVVQVARSIIPADADALASFSTSIVGNLWTLRSRLTPGQRVALRHVASEIGWHDAENPTPALDDVISDAGLAGLEIAVYTLTETAGRQARDLLLAAAPGVRVEITNDRVGTNALATLAGRVDLFVIAWASATHAATNFIRDRRGKKPIAYAAGRGAASIVRAVEEWSSAGLR